MVIQKTGCIPNGHTTSNRCRLDVDITLIRRRPNFDEFSRHFHVPFRCNFADQEIHIVSTYFFQHNFDGRKIRIVSAYIFRCNFTGQKRQNVSTFFYWRGFAVKTSMFFPRTIFDVVSMVEKSTLSVLVLKLFKWISMA